MRTPSVPEAILEMVLAKAVELKDAAKYFENYKYFEDSRAKIEAQYAGRWVLSVNRKLFTDDSRKGVLVAAANEPDLERGYVEHVGKAI